MYCNAVWNGQLQCLFCQTHENDFFRPWRFCRCFYRWQYNFQWDLFRSFKAYHRSIKCTETSRSYCKAQPVYIYFPADRVPGTFRWQWWSPSNSGEDCSHSNSSAPPHQKKTKQKKKKKNKQKARAFFYWGHRVLPQVYPPFCKQISCFNRSYWKRYAKQSQMDFHKCTSRCIWLSKASFGIISHLTKSRLYM